MNIDRFKFRAWHPPVLEDGEDWGSAMYYSSDSEEKRACGFTIETDSGFSNDDFIWMLSTGLRDKRRKLIFEGDIFSNGARVEWGEGGYVVLRHIKELGTDEFYPLGSVAHMLEIIGNIYENPELLPNN